MGVFPTLKHDFLVPCSNEDAFRIAMNLSQRRVLPDIPPLCWLDRSELLEGLDCLAGPWEHAQDVEAHLYDDS